ncbi:hypothetical protein BS47DRAFT_1484474 [Hydnum rufescens UP504]|uniref:Uncharacterized protein n=1 Tax=Hydnum rufescens UP504 TaxID=1448309 RepID=A0A9P6DZ17_9AGAM|nr:hypothetical protein BS47DRAFT_1484474 [Hydnum rufescens UP504]
MAELVPHAHAHPQWVEASNKAYEMLCSEVNVLRTVMDDKAMVVDFSAEEHGVAVIFLRDFEPSGIDLPPLQREQSVSLSDELFLLDVNS